MSDATVSPWSWEGGTNDNPAVAWSGQNSYRFMATSGSLEFPNLVTWRNDGEARGAGADLSWRRRSASGRATARADLIRHFAAVIRGDEPSTDRRS